MKHEEQTTLQQTLDVYTVYKMADILFVRVSVSIILREKVRRGQGHPRTECVEVEDHAPLMPLLEGSFKRQDDLPVRLDISELDLTNPNSTLLCHGCERTCS
jgi:hypothetical protein